MDPDKKLRTYRIIPASGLTYRVEADELYQELMGLYRITLRRDGEIVALIPAGMLLVVE